MPLFDYVCQECHHQQETLIRGDETPRCDACGSEHMEKLLSLPVAHTTGGPNQGPRPGGSCGPSCGCCPPLG